SVDLRSLDQECDADVGAVLVEVLAADAGRDDFDRADVAQRALGLQQRLFGGVVGGRLGATDQLDDCHDSHADPPRRSSMVSLALTPSSRAARCQAGACWRSGAAAEANSASNWAIAAATAAASSPLAVFDAMGTSLVHGR